MRRVSYTLIAGALVLATLLKESSCFTLHRFDQINEAPHEVFIDTHPATATGSDDESVASLHDRLFKRSLPTTAAHQLTAAEWELLLHQMISQHNVHSSSDESIQHPTHSADGGPRGKVLSNQNQHLDDSDESLDDEDDGWNEVKDVELMKKMFGISWESVKDMKFDHMSTEDLIEDWLHTQNKAQHQNKAMDESLPTLG